MRKSGKYYLWPMYFDSSNCRGDTRRLSKELALRDVKIKEIADALKSLGISAVVEEDAAHPSQHWIRCGVAIVEKTRGKSPLLRLVAEKMRENRSLRKEH